MLSVWIHPWLCLLFQEARCGYAIAIMALYWCTECMPLAVTALLPVVLFPMMGIMKADEVLLPLAHLPFFFLAIPIIFELKTADYELKKIELCWICVQPCFRSALSIWRTLTCCSLVGFWWPSRWRNGTFTSASLSEFCCSWVSVRLCKTELF